MHVVHALRRRPLPDHVETLEVGTAFLEALPAIERADRIVVVDAMHADHAPGTLYRIPFEDCLKPECIASLHGFDLSRVLYLAGRTVPPEVVVIGVEPERIEWGTEPSGKIQEVLPAIIETVMAEIDRPVRSENLTSRES